MFRRALSIVKLLINSNAVLIANSSHGNCTEPQSRRYVRLESSKVGKPRRTTYALVRETKTIVTVVIAQISPNRARRSRAP
jgi:hypothetical protein